MPDWIGKTIGKVRIDKYLARGGMAEVYLGTHLTLERPVAVKVLHGFIEEHADMISRFHREAKVVAALRHPGIVQLYDFDTVDGHPYIVMEYLNGPTLANYLRTLHSRNELIPSHQIGRLLKGLTAAMDYAHTQGVIHRDIKPGNMILQSNSGEISTESPLPKDTAAIVTDFGLVRIANSATQTASGMISGTAAYMSPEQARGDKTDHRTDIYSLGIVLYEMLAGRVPFEADTTLSLMYKQINEPPPAIKGISPAIQSVLDRALRKNPDDRYQTNNDMAAEFLKAVGMNAEAETLLETPISQSGVTGTSNSTTLKPAASKRVGLLAGIGLALCVLAVIGGLTMRSLLAGRGGTTQAPPSAEPVESQTGVVALPDADNMIQIPAGTYTVGRAQLDDFHGVIQNINLPEYWIDQYQVTNEQYRQFMEQTQTREPLVFPAPDKAPVRGVTWDEANAYCGWQNKRLPKEAEWEAAGRGSGTDPQIYPWGNDASQALQLPDQDAYEVGSISFNVSPFGVYDLVGNVWEWTGDPYTTINSELKVLRGGRYGLPQDLAYRLIVATNNNPYTKYAGFRCAADQVK